MKKRYGFVSNSSSSSFIIGCSAIPKTLDEAAKIWFKEPRKVSCESLESLFRNMEEIKVDFDLMETLPMPSYFDCEDECYSDNGDLDKTKEIYRELFYEFYYGESIGWKGYWARSEKSEMDIFVEKVIGDSDDWTIKHNATDAYFKQDHIIAKFREFVEVKTADLKNQNVFMQCEYGDDGDGYMEHEFNWNLFPAVKRFSHH